MIPLATSEDPDQTLHFVGICSVSVWSVLFSEKDAGRICFAALLALTVVQIALFYLYKLLLTIARHIK